MSLTTSTRTVDTNGDTRWTDPQGRLHREDGPALERPDGSLEWHLYGVLHRAAGAGPAVITADGTQEWFWNGLRHRFDGPAVIRCDGVNVFYLAGLLHRDHGPAIEFPGGTGQWAADGRLARTDEFELELPNGEVWAFDLGLRYEALSVDRDDLLAAA